MTFKTFISDDIATTRTLLHEAVPVSGSIVQTGANIKKFGHQMFQSVYDYTYTNSSANHIFDITHGHHPDFQPNKTGEVPVALTTTHGYYNKRRNIYNQMAQVLAGNTSNGSIRKFDKDGDLIGTSGVYESLIFINFARLLGKDEIKKGSFSLVWDTSVSNPATAANTNTITISDAGAESNYKVNSPAGEYGILTITATSGNGLQETFWDGTTNVPNCGLIFYQAGVVALSTEIFNAYDVTYNPNGFLTTAQSDREVDGSGNTYNQLFIDADTNMDDVNDAIRSRIYSINFNNTTELNSTIYFCRVGHNDFNYSSNPTYLENSKIRVKNRTTDAPVSYITTVGLYSARNELLAVAKLSEPLRKDPTNDITLRVRLDY